jgi:hypothetical protein
VSENSTITKPLVAAINALPFCVAHRMHSGKVKVARGWMQLEPEGTPDVLALLRSSADRMHQAVYFETKSPDGRMRPAQEALHTELRRIGFRVEVPRSFAEAMSIVREVLGRKETG